MTKRICGRDISISFVQFTSLSDSNWHTHVLRSAESDTGDARNMLQAELSNGLASLLLVARVDGGDGRAGGDGRGFTLSIRVGVLVGILDGGLSDLLSGDVLLDFLNTGFGRHDDRCGWYVM